MVDTLDDIFPGTISGAYASLFPEDDGPHIPDGFVSRYRASALTTGDTVASWPDAGSAAIARTATSDPVVAVVGGHKAVVCDSNDVLSRPALLGAYTVLIAFRWTTITASAQVVSSNTGSSSNHTIGKSSTGTLIMNNGAVLDSGVVATAGLTVMGNVWNGSTSILNANGTTVTGSSGLVAAAAGNVINLGAAIASGASEVAIYEEILYPTALSASALAAGVAQLMADYS